MCTKVEILHLLTFILGTGELQISLETTKSTTIRLYRPAINNLVVALADNLFPKDGLSELQHTLAVAGTQVTSRTFYFRSLSGQVYFLPDAAII